MIKDNYIIVDYFTGKQIDVKTYQTKKEAEMAKNGYLKQCIINKIVHNNLLLIKKV